VCPECGDVWMDAYSSARFTELEVRPSSLIYGADNRVQVDFSLDRLMPSGSKIQIHVDPLRLKLSNGEGTVFGRSRIWFEPAAKWIDEPPGLVVTSTQNIPAHTRLSFSVMFVNSDDATGSADLDVQVSSRSDFFSSLLGQSWASAGRLKSAAVLTRMVGPAFSSTAMPKFRKIIMMDITVLGSVFISSLDVHLPSNVTSQTLDIYYKEGSYASAKKNLTEWRLLGRVTTQDLPRHGNVAVRLRLSDLKSQFSEGEARQYADQMQDLAGLAGFTPIQTWLGARPSWVNNSARHMSSTLGSGVDLRKVFNLSHAGLWHSGNGTGTWSEAGCPHLPKCPVHWPFDKNQWIAFDTGVCYTLSAFRTVFPNYTQAPTYNFGGIKRNNINEDDWSQAHFRYFELQYSTTGLQGPWRAALNGEAQAGQSNQHFPFQPVTARYWRLLLMDNFGFGYFALKSIEFFGFESPWCADSRWCQASQECQTTQNDLISVQYNQDASLQQYGLALTAGLHSFMLSASHGLLVSDSDRRRSDVGKSDGTLMLHHAAQIDRKNDKARIEMERTLPTLTSPLGKTKHLRLPTSSKLCHSRFRLVVKEMFNLTTGHGGASGRNVCLDQFALFEQMDPQWIVHNISSAQIAVDASSQLSGYLAETATNGQFAPGNLSSSSSATFCWNSEMIKPDEWISVTFPHSICVAGYALLDHDNQLSFSAWELQGSDDGGNWTILDRRRHEISKQRLWRKFALAESRPANYLFSNGLTYGYALSNEGGVEGESPRLHRFDDDAETWALGQLLGGGGVHDVEHFVVGQEHFLALARSLTSAGPEGVSEVMRWDGQAFVADHTLPIGWCTSIAYFAHNSSHYLVASDHGRDAPYTSSEVSVLKYQGATGGWAEVQRISQSPTSSIHVVQPYSAAGNLFLFVALSPLSTDCHGAFSCMQSAVFECDAGNRTQEISLHSSGYLVADANHSSRCRWIVAPPKASSVTLTFTKLDIVPCCRQIIVYSCADATCVSKTMLDNLVDSGSLDKISSSTGVLAVEYATYFPEVNVVCSGSCVNTAACTSAQGSTSGTITDGPSNYQNGWSCTWDISLAQAFVGTSTSISFKLSEFETYATYDTLEISLCDTGACTADYSYSGSGSCADNPGFSDSSGDGCDWYIGRDASTCTSYTNTDGVNAATACCVCGGGSFGTFTSTSGRLRVSFQAPVRAGSCADNPGFSDSSGDGCDWYIGQDASTCTSYTNTDGVNAATACCVCGGGSYVDGVNGNLSPPAIKAGFAGTWTLHTSQPTSGTFFEARFDTTVAEPGPGSLITYKWKDKVVTVDYCSNEADCRARAGCDEGWCFEGTCFRGYTDPGCSAVEDGGRYAGQEEGFWCFSGRSDSYCPSVPSVQGQFETESDGEHVMHLDGVDTVALDLEPFESAHNPGEHFLAVATVPSSPLETSSDSLVYKLSSGRLQVWQRLAGPPAVRCKHIRKDGLDYLLIASYAGNSSIYRWNTIADSGIGRNGFTIAGHLPVSRTLSLEAFEAGGAVLLSLTASSGSKNGSLSASGSDSASGSGPMSQTTVVHVLRWMDALQWHGSFEYTDAFMPSASFAVRQLRETTLVPSGNRTYVATFQSDRSLPPGSTIRIMRITGVEQSEQHVEIFGQDAPVFGGLGLWEQASETLQITATRWIGSDHQISVGFSIGKGYKPRSALYAQISCSGSVIILPQDMETFGNGWPAQTGRLRQDCTRGHTAIDGWPCTACPPGTYKDTIGSAPCTPCAVGTFSPLTGRTLACDALCERGRYAIGGNSICDLCPAHTYTARQGSNLTNCTCNLGYTGLHGRACTSCIAGTFKDTNGSAACTRCAAGKYSTELAEIFEATCMVCPLYSDSMPGANNITNCSCNVGYTGERFMLCRIAYPAETPYFV